MLPYLLLTVQYCILNSTGTGINATLANASDTTAFLQFLNSSPCLGGSSALGFGILAIALLVAFGVMALRFDIAVAGAVAGWFGVVISLFLIQLGLLSPNTIGVALALNIIMTVITLLKGALNPY